MQLREYLIVHGLSGAGFARKIGVRKMSVSRYARRLRIPSSDIMARIVAATGGQVTANDFYGPAGTAEGASGPAAKGTAGASPAVAA